MSGTLPLMAAAVLLRGTLEQLSRGSRRRAFVHSIRAQLTVWVLVSQTTLVIGLKIRLCAVCVCWTWDKQLKKVTRVGQGPAAPTHRFSPTQFDEQMTQTPSQTITDADLSYSLLQRYDCLSFHMMPAN